MNPPQAYRMRKALELILFNVALVCVLLVGMELMGQVVFYLWKGYPVFRPRPAAEEGVLELHPYLVGRPRQGIRAEAETPGGTRLPAAAAQW